MLHDVVAAQPLPGHRLRVRFDDGLEGEVDVSTLVRFEGVFAALVDPERFAEVRVHPELGTVCWPNGADLAPEALYAMVSGAAVPIK